MKIGLYMVRDKLLASTIFKDSLWALFGSSIGKGLSFIAGIIVARFLTKEVYGEYAMIKNTLVYIAIFSTFGMGYTATKYIATSKEKGSVKDLIRSMMNITLFTSGLMAILLFIFSTNLAIYLKVPYLSFAFKLLAVNIILGAITTTQIGILAGFRSFKIIAQNNAISGSLTFVLSVILTYTNGLNGALLALLLSQLVNCIINTSSVNNILKKYDKRGKNENSLYKELINFSFPIALQEGFYSLVFWLNTFLLIKLSGYGELGLYSASVQWSAVIVFIPAVLRNVVLSHLSENLDNETKYYKVLNKMLLVNFISTTIPVSIIFIFSNYINVFYGESFSEIGTIISISIFTTIFDSMLNVYFQQYMSIGKNWQLFFIKLTKNWIILLGGWWSIKNDLFSSSGAYNLVLVTLIVQMLTFVYFFVRHSFKQ